MNLIRKSGWTVKLPATPVPSRWGLFNWALSLGDYWEKTGDRPGVHVSIDADTGRYMQSAVDKLDHAVEDRQHLSIQINSSC